MEILLLECLTRNVIVSTAIILMNYELLEDRDCITFVLHFNAWSCAYNRVGLHKCWLEG